MEKIFLNLKLKMLLPVEVYKVADVLFACQKDGYVTVSSNNAKSMHMSNEAVEIAVQTLLDREILCDPSKEGSFWKFRINGDMIKRYNDASWDDVNNAPLIHMSTEVKFTRGNDSVAVEESDIFDGMSKQQMMRMMRALSAKIKEQTVPPEHAENDIPNDLPW